MKIFFSHSSTDKPLLRELKKNLAPGLQEWIDEREIEWGADLEGSIRDAVVNSDLFIVLLSDKALDSKWVKNELEWASKKEEDEESIFVLPILLPEMNKDRIPKGINRRLFLTLNDSEESSVKSLAEKINYRILKILVKRNDSRDHDLLEAKNLSIEAKSRVEKYIGCSEKIENINNLKTRKQLTKVLDSASKLIYVVVGAPQIYQHDLQILEGMSMGGVYRATHPFSANKSAHNLLSVQFRAYTQAQILAARRGVVIKRLYILPSESVADLSDLEEKHLYEINKENIESKITYLSNIPPSDQGEDFVVFDDNLLGVAVPKKGEMYGSEYRYSIDSDSEIIETYQEYFDLLFDHATPLEDILKDDEHAFRNDLSLHSEYQYNVNEPAFVLQTPVFIHGKQANRLMIVLRTAGCAYDKNNMGCTMCDFKRHAAKPSEINSDVLTHQLNYSLNQATFGTNEVSQVDLLTLGSFLHDNEVPVEFRHKTFERFARIDGLKKIVIESRSPYINEKKLLSLKKLLREDQILEIGLGVESSNELIRNDILRKNLSDTEIMRVINTCADTNVEFLGYLLIGSMTLSENDAVQDAIDSANYLADLCKVKNVKFRIAFEPIFITHGTELEEMYIQGNYKLISLWAVVDVIRSTSHLGTIFVGLSDEGLSSYRTPSGCPKCTGNIKLAIERFNGSQSLSEFEGLSCECQA